MPEALKRLIHSIGYLPGIGEKSATKLAFFLLNANKQYIEALTENLKNIHEKVTPCPVCFSLCDTGRSLCNICNNSSRDHTAICIVEEYLDMMTIEDSGGYTGVYHVLGGAISPMNGVFVGDLRIRELMDRIESADSKIEIILATNPNIEGEATSSYITEEITKKGLKHKTKITRLSRGLSAGYIEYADNITLVNALRERKEV